ncbi:MAG: ABC transporter ATP-binding protein [Verrucomicrobiales bacterium]|nr:ABC transporter ATP-binding protein [Verrucomicrobiales bacterium]
MKSTSASQVDTVGRDSTESDVSAQPILEAVGLRKAFGGTMAVDGTNLTVYPGEIYGFLGTNGAGKTTTIRLLMGILKLDAGSLRLFGEATQRTSLEQKQRIGYVSQEPAFYPWMTCRYLGRFVGGLYPSWDSTEFERLLDLFELPRDRRAEQLSGGMKAKLALALALAPRPDLLVLDEPTAGLDPLARREFMDTIVTEARTHRRTTFFSSHLIDEVERCADRIGIIQAGRMRWEGPLGVLRREVRRIAVKVGSSAELPPTFAVWKEESVEGQRVLMVRALLTDWDSLPDGCSLHPTQPSLEDIFIACVSGRRGAA